jgi:hypothetical protein
MKLDQFDLLCNPKFSHEQTKKTNPCRSLIINMNGIIVNTYMLKLIIHIRIQTKTEEK